MDDAHIEFRSAVSADEYGDGVILFREYAATLHFGLEFQGFQKELELIDTKYGTAGGGALIVSYVDGLAVGCVAIRKHADTIGEIKRLYVKPEFRALKIGTRLMDLALENARELGYRTVRLDTLSGMHAAIALYRKLGFYEIDAYYPNPIPSAVYLEKKLD